MVCAAVMAYSSTYYYYSSYSLIAIENKDATQLNKMFIWVI